MPPRGERHKGFYHRLRPHIIERHVYVQKGDKSLADLYKNLSLIYIFELSRAWKQILPLILIIENKCENSQ